MEKETSLGQEMQNGMSSVMQLTFIFEPEDCKHHNKRIYFFM